jgi:hypothetical protein
MMVNVTSRKDCSRRDHFSIAKMTGRLISSPNALEKMKLIKGHRTQAGFTPPEGSFNGTAKL